VTVAIATMDNSFSCRRSLQSSATGKELWGLLQRYALGPQRLQTQMPGALLNAILIHQTALHHFVIALSRRPRRRAQIAHQHSSVTQWVTHITSVASARDVLTSREGVYSKSQRTRRAPSKCRRSSVLLSLMARPYSKHLPCSSTVTSLRSSTTKFSSTALMQDQKQIATVSRVQQLLLGNWRQRVAKPASPSSHSKRQGVVTGKGST